MSTSELENLSCIVFDHLPSDADIIQYLVDNRKERVSKFEELFHSFNVHLQKMYNDLNIPMLSDTIIRKEFHQLIAHYRKNNKHPSVQFKAKIHELFHVTKCVCFVNDVSVECSCIPEHRIPGDIMDYYLDQLGTRSSQLRCDCSDNHRIKILIPESQDALGGTELEWQTVSTIGSGANDDASTSTIITSREKSLQKLRVCDAHLQRIK